MDVLNNIIFVVGQYSYFILIISTLTILYNKHTLYYYYIFGVIINSILNITLKLLIKEPRPQQLKKTNLTKTLTHNNETHNDTSHAPHDTPLYATLTHFNIYGMPSGHAQFAFFSTVYIWLAFKNIKLSLFYFAVSLITLYQRVKYNMHTIFQVAVGSLIGSLMGVLTFAFFKKKIVGILNFKPDDNFKISHIGANL